MKKNDNLPSLIAAFSGSGGSNGDYQAVKSKKSKSKSKPKKSKKSKSKSKSKSKKSKRKEDYSDLFGSENDSDFDTDDEFDFKTEMSMFGKYNKNENVNVNGNVDLIDDDNEDEDEINSDNEDGDMYSINGFRNSLQHPPSTFSGSFTPGRKPSKEGGLSEFSTTFEKSNSNSVFQIVFSPVLLSKFQGKLEEIPSISNYIYNRPNALHHARTKLPEGDYNALESILNESREVLSRVSLDQFNIQFSKVFVHTILSNLQSNAVAFLNIPLDRQGRSAVAVSSRNSLDITEFKGKLIITLDIHSQTYKLENLLKRNGVTSTDKLSQIQIYNLIKTTLMYIIQRKLDNTIESREELSRTTDSLREYRMQIDIPVTVLLDRTLVEEKDAFLQFNNAKDYPTFLEFNNTTDIPFVDTVPVSMRPTFELEGLQQAYTTTTATRGSSRFANVMSPKTSKPVRSRNKTQPQSKGKEIVTTTTSSTKKEGKRKKGQEKEKLPIRLSPESPFESEYKTVSDEIQTRYRKIEEEESKQELSITAIEWENWEIDKEDNTKKMTVKLVIPHSPKKTGKELREDKIASILRPHFKNTYIQNAVKSGKITGARAMVVSSKVFPNVDQIKDSHNLIKLLQSELKPLLVKQKKLAAREKHRVAKGKGKENKSKSKPKAGPSKASSSASQSKEGGSSDTKAGMFTGWW